MRTIRTFVLRLLLDTEDPHALRGAIRCVTNADEHYFGNQELLLNALQQMICRILEAEEREQKHEEI